MGDKMKYVRRNSEGVLIDNGNKTSYLKGLRQFINELCLRNLSTFKGRENASQFILKKRSVLPVYIDKETFLFPSESIRNFNCVYLNYHEVLNIESYQENYTKITFYDLSELVINISYPKIARQIVRVELILNCKNNMKINENK